MPASTQTYYPNFSSSTSYTGTPRYIATAAYRPGDLVVRTQLALRRDGLYHGNIDGIFGPRTSEALEDFQSRHGLRVTGSLNPRTMASLFGGAPAYQGSSAPPTAYQPRYPGLGYRTHGQIARAQLALRRDGLYHGNIDGLLGPETRRALGEFQSRHGLPITDNLNRATMASLFGSAPVYQGR
ncbi:MAG TPA: peptidoglycan-binding protein [Stellaceae bacterium]|nr:peptidoglycan-binding protein [Stellaceae bacterium]